jgi:hypothetical protein
VPVKPISELRFRADKITNEQAGWANTNSRVGTLFRDVIDTIYGGGGVGDVIGPAGAIDGNVVLFDGTTGKLIKDSGYSIATLPGYKIIQDKGTPLTQRSTLNFTGAGVNVTDDGTNTVVTIAGGTTVNLPANPGDDTKVAVASGGNLTYQFIGDAQVSSISISKLGAIAALSVLANATNASAVPTALAASADGQVLMRSGTSLVFGTVVAASITNSTITLAKLANGTACSVLGRSANSSGAYADMSLGTNDHVLMRTSNVVTSGFVANANVATAAAIAGTKIAPNFGSQNVVTTGNGTFNDITLNGNNLLFSTASSPIISQNDNNTVGGTGAQFSITGQNVTGTGATVGALVYIRGGNSTNGTGGGLSLASGSGVSATSNGAFSMAIGTTSFFDYPGNKVPATVGMLKAYHNVAIITGRDNGNAANRNGVRWGTTTDTWIFGDSAVATQVQGSTVDVGDTTFFGFEHAYLASSQDIIALCRSVKLTTAHMPANSGSGVINIAAANSAPDVNPGDGFTLYVTSQGLFARSPGGVVTMIASV